MKHPVHPGRLVKNMCLEPLNLTITEAANFLGVTRPTLSNVINGKAALSLEMAIRLSKAFGSTAETWLHMQVAYDLAQVKHLAHTIKVKRYPPHKAAQALGNHLKTLPILDNRSPDELLGYDDQGLPTKD